MIEQGYCPIDFLSDILKGSEAFDGISHIGPDGVGAGRRTQPVSVSCIRSIWLFTVSNPLASFDNPVNSRVVEAGLATQFKRPHMSKPVFGRVRFIQRYSVPVIVTAFDGTPNNVSLCRTGSQSNCSS